MLVGLPASPSSKTATRKLKLHYITKFFWALLNSITCAKERSAFCTRRGLLQITRMPVGLSNAPSSFCRLMHIILKDLLYVQCLWYLDDIVVFADSPEQLLKRLDAVFSRLRQCGLKAKPSKCVLFKSPIAFPLADLGGGGSEPAPPPPFGRRTDVRRQ